MRIFPESGTLTRGTLIYSESEFSFRFDVIGPTELRERIGGSGVSSLSIGTLQLEFGVASRQLLFAWGLHPRSKWIDAAVIPPLPVPSLVFVDPKQSYSEAATISIAPVNTWITEYDQRTGWVIISPNGSRDTDLFEIANGVVLGQQTGELSSVWLKPIFE